MYVSGVIGAGKALTQIGNIVPITNL